MLAAALWLLCLLLTKGHAWVEYLKRHCIVLVIFARLCLASNSTGSMQQLWLNQIWVTA